MNPIEVLSIEEKEIVRRAISVMPKVLTFEFEARMGISEESASSLLSVWPKVDDSDDNSDACLAINNSLNDLLHGEGVTDQQCQEFTGANRKELLRIYRKWATARGWVNTGIR
jgi:hypothetical protein